LYKYRKSDGVEVGPVTGEELLELEKRGVITPSTLIIDGDSKIAYQVLKPLFAKSTEPQSNKPTAEPSLERQFDNKTVEDEGKWGGITIKTVPLRQKWCMQAVKQLTILYVPYTAHIYQLQNHVKMGMGAKSAVSKGPHASVMRHLDLEIPLQFGWRIQISSQPLFQ